jgi:cytochrome P450
MRYMPGPQPTRFRQYQDYMNVYARELIRSSEVRGDGRDIMSVLLRASQAEGERSGLTESETVSQISCVSVATFLHRIGSADAE